MNEVKLIDFDKETLSKVSEIVMLEVRELSIIKNKFTDAEIERLLEFNTQVLYAFSLVKEREKVTEN